MSQQVAARVLRQQWETYVAAATESGHTPDRARWRVLRDFFVADTAYPGVTTEVIPAAEVSFG